jgi:hypothetical protein
VRGGGREKEGAERGWEEDGELVGLSSIFFNIVLSLGLYSKPLQ